MVSPDKEIYKDLLETLKDDDDPTKNYKPNKQRILGIRFDSTREYLRSLFFKNDIDSSDKSIEIGLNNLMSFYDDLNSAEILRIRVPNLNDAFTIFTSFNAKGVPLTLIDLFKSFYLKESDGNLSEEQAMIKWEELISIFYNENDEPISSVITQFLLNNYDTFESDTLSSITQNSALEVYEKLFSDNGFQYIDTLIHRAEVFSNITGKIGTVDLFDFETDTEKLLFKLDRLNITQVYPLVLYILNEYYEERITEPLLQDLLEFLVTFYVRRNISLKPKASDIRARALRAVRTLQEVEIIDINKINEVKEILKVKAVSDEEFKAALAGDVYEISKNTVRNYTYRSRKIIRNFLQ